VSKLSLREKIEQIVRDWLETYLKPPELEIPPKYNLKGGAKKR